MKKFHITIFHKDGTTTNILNRKGDGEREVVEKVLLEHELFHGKNSFMGIMVFEVIPTLDI